MASSIRSVQEFAREGNDPARVVVIGKTAIVYLQHEVRPSLLFTGSVGKKLPTTWAEWNDLPSLSLTHEGPSADRRWAEVVSEVRGAA